MDFLAAGDPQSNVHLHSALVAGIEGNSFVQAGGALAPAHSMNITTARGGMSVHTPLPALVLQPLRWSVDGFMMTA